MYKCVWICFLLCEWCQSFELLVLTSITWNSSCDLRVSLSIWNLEEANFFFVTWFNLILFCSRMVTTNQPKCKHFVFLSMVHSQQSYHQQTNMVESFQGSFDCLGEESIYYSFDSLFNNKTLWILFPFLSNYCVDCFDSKYLRYKLWSKVFDNGGNRDWFQHVTDRIRLEIRCIRYMHK